MGKLAERFQDVGRSGIYRVRDAGVPRAAAVEAAAVLVETRAASLAAGGIARLRVEARPADGAPCVVLVHDGGGVGDDPALLQELRATAARSAAAGRALFIVVVDPGGRVALPLLYHERALD